MASLAAASLSPGAPNFDRVARLYRWAEYLALGPMLERTRLHHLDTHSLAGVTSSRSHPRVLVLGDGDGRFTAALLAHNPRLKVHALDLSATMLTLLHARAPAAQTYHLDARERLPPGTWDLVVTHFFLDCLTQAEIESLALRLRPSLRPGALWLVSEFRIPPGILRLPARLYVRALYFAFRILTGLRIKRLPDHASALRAAGFKPVSLHHKMLGMLTTEVWRKP